MISFQCGHSYHRGCVVEQQNIFLCQVCCQRNEQYAYDLLLLNSKIKLDKLTENLKQKKVQTFDDEDFDDREAKKEEREEQKVNKELNDLMH